MEWLRILMLLLHKSLLIRKRQWKSSLIGEILVPVGVILAVWTVRNQVAEPSVPVDEKTVYEKVSLNQIIENGTYTRNLTHVFYAPGNQFTRTLMGRVAKCLKIDVYNNSLHEHSTEDEAIEDYETTDTGVYAFGKHGAVIFQDNITSSTKNLKYKIRMKNLNLKRPFNILGNMRDFYTISSMFLQLQSCIDQSFIEMKKPTTDFKPELYIQQMPYPPHIKYDLADLMFRRFFSAMAVAVFMIPLVIESITASSEKFIGVNVLMKMNGVSNALNLLSWLINGSLFLIIFCIIPMTTLICFSAGGALPYLYYGNPVLVGFVLSLNVIHLLAYGIHISAYFPTPLLVLFGILICNTGVIVLQQFGLSEDQYVIIPFLGVLFPNLLMYRTIDELNHFENIREGNHFKNLFTLGSEAYGFGGCMGMIIILSIIGIIVQFTLAIYVYEINPGKYGVRKHPLFFLKTAKNQSNFKDKVEDLEYDNDGRPFESPPKGLYSPGIQLRNLKKSYKLGFFNNMQVHALKGVSIDFYKGTITSLLGHNGAGKTTMMSILTGMMSPSEGTVLVNSKNIEDHSKEIMNDMGLCTQVNMVFPNLTVCEQLEFFAKLKGKNKSDVDIERRVTDLLKKLRLYEKRNSLLKNLSGGQKRRVCLGMALVGDPAILILDEPSSGLDPESRRIIWDILLKMRGQKTIIISTHDMEEADILGDRIAIMHSGQLRSYGSTMFLKKLIGQGNVEVTLSIEPWSNKERILRELDNKGAITNADGSKIVISLPDSPDLPDSLDKLDSMKKELGVSGLSVSLLSLEQVFLQVTQDNNDPTKTREPFSHVNGKLTGRALFKQILRGLLYKKIVYTLKNFSTVLLMLVSVFVMLFCLSLIFQKADFIYPKPNIVRMTVDQYEEPVTYYKAINESIGQHYKKTVQNFGGSAIETKTDLIEALLEYAKKSLSYYDNHMIAAAEMQLSGENPFVTALYSEKTTYSLPISMNLLSNSIIKHLIGSDASIYTLAQEIPTINVVDNSTQNGYTTGVIFIFLLLSAFAQFVIHPLRESSRNVKQLQRMAGVSFFTYWGVQFFFDLMIFLGIIGLIVGGFAAMNAIYDLKLFDIQGILILFLLLVLFAVNVLPLIYTFSFINAATISVLRLLTYVPMGLVLMEVVGLIFSEALKDDDLVQFLRPIQRSIFLLFPYISLLHGQMAFFARAMANARCKNMPNVFYNTGCRTAPLDNCCYLKCYDGECERHIDYFNKFEGDINLERSLVVLALTPFLYFGILAALEYQLIPKLKARMKNLEVPECSVDEQVKEEKMAISDKISTMNNAYINENYNHFTSQKSENGHTILYSNSRNSIDVPYDDTVFLVYELRKKYGNLLAVQDVSFSVNKRECFGLLGVNGAGKSTTFRMMTGQEVPDHGIMYIGDREFTRNRKYFLSQMGYCPQNDAIVKSLNSYDHLRLFARLRGIPEDQVEMEVIKWIKRLNLNACASQPSGTYSGGNKRRLNIAMALIGLPSLILMDEPTAGVDPGARRSLWNVIQSCQMSGQAVVLTSHSMEECEALCNRLAIMVGGRLVCIGPSQELKQRFGAGYDIQIKMNPEKEAGQVERIRRDMAHKLDCKVVDENTGYLMYHVIPNGTSWRKMYDVMNEMQSRYDCIEDFSVLSSTLEQLFLQFARAANDPNHKTD